jgi:hypothetical protein
MPGVIPDNLHVILMIVAGWIGFFAAVWFYAFFFTSSKTRWLIVFPQQDDVRGNRSQLLRHKIERIA